MNADTRMRETALAAFRQPPLKYNCAQSVVHAYAAEHPGCGLDPADFAALGGGRAPENTCGALWGACAALPEHATVLRAEFKAAAGADTCMELKRDRGYPCAGCVTLAVALVAKHAGAAAP